MAAMRFEQVQRFILAKKIFWGQGHFKQNQQYDCDDTNAKHTNISTEPKVRL